MTFPKFDAFSHDIVQGTLLSAAYPVYLRSKPRIEFMDVMHIMRPPLVMYVLSASARLDRFVHVLTSDGEIGWAAKEFLATV
jgi:hypothetical protein